MSVRVRLTRVGNKKNPIWRVVVADQRSPRDGRFIEMLGHYNPQTEPSEIVLDRDRLDHWLARGAQPSNTVRKLMRAPNTVPQARAQPAPVSVPEAAPAAEPEPEPATDAKPAAEVPPAADPATDAAPAAGAAPAPEAAPAEDGEQAKEAETPEAAPTGGEQATEAEAPAG